MASKARQSVFGGFFGLSLNFVILPFFMRLRSSCGYDADHVAPHCISDEKSIRPSTRPIALKRNSPLASRSSHTGPGTLSQPFESRHRVLPIGLFLSAVPLEDHCEPRTQL